LEEFYALKLHIHGIIVSFCNAVIHNDNNALCSRSVETSPMILVTKNDCFLIKHFPKYFFQWTVRSF